MGGARTARAEHQEAERLAREAVARGTETDMLNAHADALIDLADVLTRAGRDARPELEHVLALYERNGNLVMAKTHAVETPGAHAPAISTDLADDISASLASRTQPPQAKVLQPGPVFRNVS